MTIRNRIAAAMQKTLNSFGYAVVRVGTSHLSMESAMDSISGRKHQLSTVIDIGASDGSWSALMMRRFPSCNYLLIEAQPVHEEKLRDFCTLHPNARYSLVAAGEGPGMINFDASQPCSGQASVEPYKQNNIVVAVAAVDDEVKKNHLSGPFLLKLDTHGFEVPILKGATKVLRETEVIVMECYNFRISRESLLFDEMCQYLRKYGFRCLDLVEPLHRPLDNAFWQMDMVFVRDTRSEFSVLQYS